MALEFNEKIAALYLLAFCKCIILCKKYNVFFLRMGKMLLLSEWYNVQKYSLWENFTQLSKYILKENYLTWCIMVFRFWILWKQTEFRKLSYLKFGAKQISNKYRQ